ncbi:MAG TPA: hypothetical protein VMG30_08490 [Acidobacteriota bacterium]|nr:hypothetical protein [Acidobacteriota bacterium]
MILIAGMFLLLAVALVYRFHHRLGGRPEVTRAEAKTKDPAAELVSASGMVLKGRPGGTEWCQIAVGAHLMEGDLVQTDRTGGATIRYSNGNTVTIQENTIVAVRSAGDGNMDISAPAAEDMSVSADSRKGIGASSMSGGAEDKAAVAAFNQARANEPGPFIRLDRIVQFGRILELVGTVEAGSRLLVNNEIVDVAGDGSFKHFTDPFPSFVEKASLAMKVTDLAGRSSVVEAVHDFNPHRGKS